MRVARGPGAWDKQKEETLRAIRRMKSKIVNNRLDLIMSVHVLNTILMPQLEMAGRMVNFTQLDLKKWNSALIESVLKAHGALGRDYVCQEWRLTKLPGFTPSRCHQYCSCDGPGRIG